MLFLPLSVSFLSSPFNFFLSYSRRIKVHTLLLLLLSLSGSRSLSLSLVLHPCLLISLPAICLYPYPALNFKFSCSHLSHPISLIYFSLSLFLLPYCLFVLLFLSPSLSATLNSKDKLISKYLRSVSLTLRKNICFFFFLSRYVNTTDQMGGCICIQTSDQFFLIWLIVNKFHEKPKTNKALVSLSIFPDENVDL